MRPSRQDHEASNTLCGALAFDQRRKLLVSNHRGVAADESFNARTGCAEPLLLSTRMFFLQNASLQQSVSAGGSAFRKKLFFSRICSPYRTDSRNARCRASSRDSTRRTVSALAFSVLAVQSARPYLWGKADAGGHEAEVDESVYLEVPQSKNLQPLRSTGPVDPGSRRCR